MTMTRAEYRVRELEQELVGMKAEHNNEKAAHANEKMAHQKTQEQVRKLQSELLKSKQLHQEVQTEVRLLALAAKMHKSEAKDIVCDTEVHTDHVALRALLPHAPIHPPQIYDTSKLQSLGNQHTKPSEITEKEGAEQKNHRKRTLNAMNEETFGHQSGASSKYRIIVCIACYAHGLRCDTGEPCENCLKVGLNCKRAKCKDFEAGKCQRQSCLRAHRPDLKTYSNIVEAGHVRKKPAREPPAKRFKSDTDDKSDDDDERRGGRPERPIQSSF
ncbi:hypothetical protein NX059_001060 [Plenodomus lindquistii]|nr:hypothetical protein NX059_001060 [Plenodomus lindquistii]